ncbi:autotransporter domain-containing protein [Achromobacter sp.]|uniref:autotransporter family protein n=1 Tax=Achromobacter sp. TaxID=134375 RepID=UPI00289913FB|nr:autotransporter domain-containing protein [Achromobacter sp.]
MSVREPKPNPLNPFPRIAIVVALAAATTPSASAWAARDWFDPLTWGGAVPSASVDASVRGSEAVTLNGAGTARNVNIGQSQLGLLDIAGAAARLDAGQVLTGYNGGDGTLTVRDGAHLETRYMESASTVGSTARLEFANGATVKSADFSLAGSGLAVLSISGASTLSTAKAVLGEWGSGDATVTIAGPGSSWTNTGNMSIAGFSVARITVSAGGALYTNAGATLSSNHPSSDATVNLTGAGSEWRSGGGIVVGNLGQANVTVTDGARLSAPSIVLAASPGSTGTLVVGGNDVTPAAGGFLNAGAITFGAGTGKVLFNFTGPAVTYAGTFSGAGDLRVAAGDVVLTGNSTSNVNPLLNPRIFVDGGSLTVNGVLPGAIAVASGARLSGGGTVGATTLSSDAILAPGGLRALTVNGDLTFSPNAVLQVMAAADGKSGRVAVNGAATLTGATVQVAAAPGNYAEFTTYDILRASGTFNGTRFTGVSADLAYLTPSLSYSANDQDAQLTLTRKQVPPGTNAVSPVQPEPGITAPPPQPNPVDAQPTRPIRFADLVSGRNAIAIANAIDSMPADNEVYRHALSLPNGAPQSFFSALSGESHASAIGALQGAGGQARSVPLAHLRANLGAGLRAGLPTASVGTSDVAPASSVLPTSAAQPAWAELVGNWQRFGASKDTSEVRVHTGGVFAGADGAIGSGGRLGGAVGYTDSKLRTNGVDGKTDIASYSAIVYGGKAFDAGAGKLNLLLGGSYTWHDINSKRRIAMGGLDQTLRADYAGNTTQLFTELGYAMAAGHSLSVEPYAGLAWANLRSRAFQESGGSAALSGASQSNQTTTTTLGARARQALTWDKFEGSITAGAGWRHAFGDLNPTTKMAFDAGNAFTVAGAPIARNAALLEAGLETAMGRSGTVGLSYAGQFGSDTQDHSATLAARWAF